MSTLANEHQCPSILDCGCVFRLDPATPEITVHEVRCVLYRDHEGRSHSDGVHVSWIDQEARS